MTGYELYDRFLKLLDMRNMSKTEFCNEAGIRLSALSNWAARGTMPSADMVLSISKVLDVSTDYVLGKTDVYTYEKGANFSIDETNMIRSFRELNEEQQRQLILMLAFFKSQQV